MASKRIKPKAPEAFRTREEFERGVDEIARLDIEIKRKEAELKKRHQEIDDEFGPEVKKMSLSLQELMARAEPFFAQNAASLCKPGQREGETPLARFGIRRGMPTVGKLVSTAWKKLGEIFFGKDKLKPFTRVAPEVDKDKVLAVWRDAESGDKEIAQNAIRAKSTLQDAGLTVTQDDQFWVEAKAESQVKSNT